MDGKTVYPKRLSEDRCSKEHTSETFALASSEPGKRGIKIRTLVITFVATISAISLVSILVRGLLTGNYEFIGLVTPITQTTVTRSSVNPLANPSVTSSPVIPSLVTASSNMPMWKFWSSMGYYSTHMSVAAHTSDRTVTKRLRFREFEEKKRKNKSKKLKKNKKKNMKKNLIPGNKVIVNVEDRCALKQPSTSQSPLVESRVVDTISQEQRGPFGWFESLRFRELVEFAVIVNLIVVIVILYHYDRRSRPVNLELV